MGPLGDFLLHENQALQHELKSLQNQLNSLRSKMIKQVKLAAINMDAMDEQLQRERIGSANLRLDLARSKKLLIRAKGKKSQAMY